MEFSFTHLKESKYMEQLIQLYRYKLEHYVMTVEECNKYEHLIALYIESMTKRLEGIKDDY